jgi:signal transduction histidine kinase
MVRIPEPLLTDLFRNLLANALKYAAETDPRIEISGCELNDRIRYRVADHGPGIDPRDVDELFEPFKRGRNARGIPGTGIGLATIARIARVYNGKVWVEKTSGGGATFVIDFPKDKNQSCYNNS